jgi:hypothetical protein
MKPVLDESFAYFYDKKAFGPAVPGGAVTPEHLARYRSKLPARLLAYWQLFGFAGFGDGRFWLVDPAEYEIALSTWIQGTPFEGIDDYFVIGRSAFGRLDVWGTRTGPSLSILPMWGMLFPSDKSKWMKEGKADFLVSMWIERMDKVDLDETDEDDQPLFERAMKLLGPLHDDEMYGFVPALALGGPCRLDHIQKVKAAEHLTLLAHLGEREIMMDIVKEAKDRGVWK